MSYKDLNDFVRQLENEGELIRIKEQVSADLEITEITDRVSKMNGPALLFENVENSEYPVLMNAFGTYERMSKSLREKELDEIGDKVGAYLEFEKLMSVKGIFSYIPKLFYLLHCIPIRKLRIGKITLGRPPKCQQVIEKEVDLSKIPILQCWPEDGGKFVTLPLVFTKYKDSISQNIGMYRMQVIDKNTTGMHWHKHKDGAGIYESYHKNGSRMPVSVAIGADPAVTYAATAPLPKGISEIFLAGFLRKKSVRMVKCITNNIYVPEESQFVLEGYVDTTEKFFEEGPFGDHTGYYSLKDFYPKFHVTCITHKKDAIYPATIVGKPPMEDCYMAKATERIFLPMLKMIMPELVEINLPLEGVFHNCAIVSIKNSFRGSAQKIMNEIWGSGQMCYTKMIIVVNEDVNPYDTELVQKKVLEHVDFVKDVTISKGPLDALDHSSNEALFGSRVGIDATKEEQHFDYALLKIVALEKAKTKAWAGRELAEKLLKDTGNDIQNEKQHDIQNEMTILHENIKMQDESQSEPAELARLILVVDHEEDITDRKTIFWRLFNNIDASRDFYYKKDMLAIDATKKCTGEGIKRPWPNDIVMSENIKKKVDEKWDSLNISLKK